VLFVALLLLARPAPAQLARQPEVAGALELLDVWMREQVETGRSPGVSVAVVRDQELVWSGGYGWSDLGARTPATAATVYRIGSVSKLFTATAILQLRDQGKLALDDPVSKYLPEFKVKNPFPATPPVTLRHLLTQTSGLTREAPFPYWTTHVFPSREQLLASLGDLTLTSPPGETYKYSNLGVALLGIVAERVSGESYAGYLRRHVFEPLGMSSSSAVPSAEQIRSRAVAYYRKSSAGPRRVFDYYDMDGMAAAGNIVASVEDLARFAMLQFRDGPAGGAQILAGATLREMQRPQFVYPSFSGGRGLGFAVTRADDVTFVNHAGWIGGNRTQLLLAPAAKIGIVVACNADDAEPNFFARQIYKVLAPAIAAATAAPAAAAVADPSWQRYVGVYTDPWGWEYEVMVMAGQLVMYEHDYPPEDDPRDGITRLRPAGENTFLMADGEPVVFELGADGKVVRVKRRFEYLTPVER
jgi:CubicO group peptidase (beta-lactamase class C family)